MIFFRQLSPDFTKTLLGIISILMALAIAIPFHEFAHAFAAKKQGDYTAVAYKRCTPAALVHFDFIGFFMMMFFGYGWAKPVPVNSNNFKNGRKSQFWVSIAGILMNLALGTIFLFIYMLIFKIDSSFYTRSNYGYMLYTFLYFSFQMNFGLAIFNLLPIYPFDGYNIIDSFCRYDNAYLRFAKRYSTIILIIVIIFGIYDLCYSFLIEKIYGCLFWLFSKILGL
jgi:Zn-dependent protease